MHDLQVEREEDDRAEHGDAGEKPEEVADREDRIPEEAQRDDRFGGALLDQHEEDAIISTAVVSRAIEVGANQPYSGPAQSR